jgi:glycosyltransferase involved in cell wall biosynthesis
MTRSFDQNSAAMNRILVAGGHERITGGLEIFISRARACLGLESHVFSDTPGSGSAMTHYVKALLRFAARLRSHDVVWLHYGSAFDLAFLVIAKCFGKKVAVTIHMGASWRTVRNSVFRTICNRLLCLADVVFVLYKTQPEQLGFPARLIRRCKVLPTFLPQALVDRPTAQHAVGNPLRLVHVARLSGEKGSFAFLDVCESLRRHDIRFEATIVGRADEETHRMLEAKITQSRLAVTLLGELPQTELMDLLKRQDVLVNLSLQDAYPLTVIEALFSGVAPVCCALPGTEELAADASVISLVNGQDGDAAANRILSIDWPAMKDGADALRSKLNWAAVSRRYGEAFSQLAERPATLSSPEHFERAAS